MPGAVLIPEYEFHERDNNNVHFSTTIKPDVPEATRSWTGKWTSNSEYWGDFTFTQNGNAITGTFAEGSFSGTVTGNTLLFSWEGDEWRLTMSPDGGKFSMEVYSSWGSTWQEFTLFEATRVS